MGRNNHCPICLHKKWFFLTICILFLIFYGLDVETFVADTLKGENLSKKAKEKRESLIKKIKDVKSM